MESWAAVLLLVLAFWILVSGFDDLVVAFVFFFRRREPCSWPSQAELRRAGQRPIAVLLPLWQEAEIIERMLRHNLSVIRYSNYDIFVGVYPNDPLTIEAVHRVQVDDGRVHMAMCDHAGPTSKGDCLNSAYRRMVEYEARQGIHFEILITHDAEDLIHPESLRLINWFSRDYEMVQIPVLPLPTGLGDWTQGLYCDEFAEYQSKDIPVRQRLGGFVPANGVGTGFTRAALENLRRSHNGKFFDPECLTEDYENGFRIHEAGYRQLFVPIHFLGGAPVATREFFPRTWRAAVRQRSRWVAGIALQGWQRHGWRVPGRQRYWFWRDRKGLAGNLISPIANLLVLCWLAGSAWGWPGNTLPAGLIYLFALTTGISVLQTGLRVQLSARLYGWRFAVFTPLRIFWGNLINCAATVAAVYQFAGARLWRHSLAWLKTEHMYPAFQSGRPVPESATLRGRGAKVEA